MKVLSNFDQNCCSGNKDQLAVVLEKLDVALCQRQPVLKAPNDASSSAHYQIAEAKPIEMGAALSLTCALGTTHADCWSKRCVFLKFWRSLRILIECCGSSDNLGGSFNTEFWKIINMVITLPHSGTETKIDNKTAGKKPDGSWKLGLGPRQDLDSLVIPLADVNVHPR